MCLSQVTPLFKSLLISTGSEHQATQGNIVDKFFGHRKNAKNQEKWKIWPVFKEICFDIHFCCKMAKKSLLQAIYFSFSLAVFYCFICHVLSNQFSNQCYNFYHQSHPILRYYASLIIFYIVLFILALSFSRSLHSSESFGNDLKYRIQGKYITSCLHVYIHTFCVYSYRFTKIHNDYLVSNILLQAKVF